MRKLLLISLAITCHFSSFFALEKDEILFFWEQTDTSYNKILSISKAYINTDPLKALSFTEQIITNTNDPLLKAKSYVQNGIIYNFSLEKKNESSLENLFEAQTIYKGNSKLKELIFTEILIGEVYRKIGDIKRANIHFENAFNSSEKIELSKLSYLAFLAKYDLNINAEEFPYDRINDLINSFQNSNLKAFAFYIGHKRAVKNGQIDLAIQYLDNAKNVYEKNQYYIQSIDMLIKKSEIYENNNNLQLVVQLNENIYEKSKEHNYGKGLIYSCYRLTDFFESIERYKLANEYLKYLNKIKSAEGEKELAERILLAEKEKKIDLERINAKNEVKFQGYLTIMGFSIALLILGIAVYIYFAYKTKSKLAADLLLAYNKNEELKKEKDNFLAYTSHEIRTPLSAVLTASEILEETSLNLKQTKHLKTLKNSASNILFLVNDILDLAKLEKSKIELENIPFSPVDTIKTAIEILSNKAINNKVKMNFHFSEHFPEFIDGDSFRFQQIVLNLLDNAIKYTPNGLVSVKLFLVENHLLSVEVKDNGKGIEKTKLDLIFKPYTQEKSNTSRQYGGTGLGLAICDLLIKLMKGKITAESNASGSIFKFTIPFTTNENPEIKASKSVLKKLNNSKILLVEDDLVNGQLFKDMISNKSNNVKVTWVKNGVEAIESIQENKYNIVLMDLEMPLKDGYQTSLEIRSSDDDEINSLPIIAMTAHVVEDIVERCYENGINDCISKPFQIENLQKKIISLTNIEPVISENTTSINKSKYMNLFKRSFSSDIENLQKAISIKDANSVKHLLHKMKGAALTMEIIPLSKLISQMEKKKLVDLGENLETLKSIFLQNTGEKI